MSPINPVLWTEGLFLRPQHFQQERRYLEALVEARCGRAVSYLWGLSSLKLDEAALSLGKVGIERCRGVFPDGTPFDLPATDPVPSYLEPQAGERERLSGRLVYLALPLRKPGVPLVSLADPAPLARWDGFDLSLPDETRGGVEAETIKVGRLRPCLLFEGSDLSDYAYLAIARIGEVRGDGQVILDQAFAPPCLDLRASPRLLDHLTALQGLVASRADELAQRVIAPGRGGTGELSEFLMLQVLNRYEPLLGHFGKLDLLHPESLFRMMLGLLGDLVTFTEKGKRGGEYPVYRHELPELPFVDLMNRLRDALLATIARKAMQLEIVERGYGIRTVSIPDPKLVTKGRFVLAAKGRIAQEKLGTGFPAQVKFGPVEDIGYLVNRNLPAIPIMLVPHRPEEIPYHEGFVYFGLDRFHELWKKIAQSSEFAFWVGGEVPGLELEMWVIKEEG